MPLVPLLPLFHRFNREFFSGELVVNSKPLLDIRWSDGRLRKTAGLYRRGLKGLSSHYSEIVLSRPVLQHLPQTALESTLCHEMIHAWIDLILKVNEGHGPYFRAQMSLINSIQDDFQVSVRHHFPVAKDFPKWFAVCSSCGVKYPYQRRVAGAACRSCCNEHYGGNWHSRFLLTYEPYM